LNELKISVVIVAASLSSQVPSTSNIPPHVQPIRTNHSTGTDTLLSSTPEASFSSTVPPVPSEIIDLPNFAYSYYSSSFTSILAYIHCLYEPSSYKKSNFLSSLRTSYG